MHNDLHKLAQRCGTDKTKHGYTTIYQRLFWQWEHDDINLCEIGVKDGKSMRLWESYFTLAQIVGIDTDPRCSRYNTARVSILIHDASQPADVPAPTIVIDDGSHKSYDQIAAFEWLFPLMLSGGYYCIEDLHVARHPRYVTGGITILDYLHHLSDGMHYKPSGHAVHIAEMQWHRKLVVIKKA